MRANAASHADTGAGQPYRMMVNPYIEGAVTFRSVRPPDGNWKDYPVEQETMMAADHSPLIKKHWFGPAVATEAEVAAAAAVNGTLFRLCSWCWSYRASFIAMLGTHILRTWRRNRTRRMPLFHWPTQQRKYQRLSNHVIHAYTWPKSLCGCFNRDDMGARMTPVCIYLALHWPTGAYSAFDCTPVTQAHDTRRWGEAYAAHFYGHVSLRVAA